MMYRNTPHVQVPDQGRAFLPPPLAYKSLSRAALVVYGHSPSCSDACDRSQLLMNGEVSMKNTCARSLNYLGAVVVIGFALAVPTTAMADLITLNLISSGITGDVTVKGQLNTIEVLSLSGNVQQPTGPGRGLPVFSDLVIQKRLDTASPALFLALVTGKHLSNGIITFLHATGDGFVKAFTITLTEIVVTKFATNDSENEVLAGHEQINLSYRKIELRDEQTGAHACWDVAKATQC
jgi:type VI secretion system Hcp family effector